MGEKKRLRYIDAMRGLAILLVVFSHVTNAYVKMPITNESFAGIYYMMTMFRMPLFFFVSGFFAYRVADKWTGATVKRVMGKKFQAQIFGLAVFCFLYGACMCHWKFHFLWTSNPYWFTESLFEMFCIYLLFALLERRTGWRWLLPALLAVSCVAPFIYNYHTEGVKMPNWVTAIQTWHTLNYMPYFMLGIFARRNEKKTWDIVDNQYFKAIMIVGFFALVIFYGCRHRYSVEWDLVMTAMRFSGLMTILIFFRSYRDYFDRDGMVSTVMTKVGSRTLDVYYLHYFFIPDLGFMKGFLSTGHGNTIVGMLTTGLVISALVVALCMLVSSLLRTSPLLASWLFGSGSRKSTSAPKEFLAE
ncbi:MAG: acyltransferase [Muribaculaceae bacterium]|nr:acyltransferase [Muribaculaceae bacterium]